MSDRKETDNPSGGENPTQQPAPGIESEKAPENFAHHENLERVASHLQEKTDGRINLNHVEALGLSNQEALQKKIVRRLDMTLLPQLWILYMFNYLNRVNIAQARLNTFDEDLGLQDGDYQVRCRERRVDKERVG